jgi:hypothetical protein
VKIRTALAIILLPTLFGCSKLTLENYGKIGVGMQYDAVIQLIGKPDRCDDVMTIRKCVWRHGKRSISVSFAANQVLLFSSSNLN